MKPGHGHRPFSLYAALAEGPQAESFYSSMKFYLHIGFLSEAISVLGLHMTHLRAYCLPLLEDDRQ